MQARNSFAVATAASIIMLIQPVGAGTISISFPGATMISVSRFLAHQDLIDDRDSRLITVDDSGVTASVAFDSLSVPQLAMNTAGTAMTHSDPAIAALPAAPIMNHGPVLSTGTRLDYASVALLAAPMTRNGFVLSTGTLLDYAWSLSSEATSFGDSTGGEKSASSTAGVRRPAIHPAPEPDALTYATAAAAMCGVWQLRRRRPNTDKA